MFLRGIMKNIHLKDVEYSLTPLGETLVEPLSLLAEWSEKISSNSKTHKALQVYLLIVNLTKQK